MNDNLELTREEARKALFDLNFEYMSHPPRERDKLYEEYQAKRRIIQEALKRAIQNKNEQTKKQI